MAQPTTPAAPAAPARTFNGETLPQDALMSTVYRISDDQLNGWNICYHNNSDLVTAWRSEGGATIEADGYVDSDVFHVARMRVVAGAVDAFGNRTFTPGPWSH